MRLADFIRRHRAEIVADSEVFAGTMQPAANDMTPPELRDHAAELLDAADADLDSPQSRQQQKQKSRGFGSARRMALVAHAHAIRRMRAGFQLTQVLAEYRALRASVVRLWEAAAPRPSAANRLELTRFHEAMDEALTECVSRYVEHVDHYRDQFLGVLGHDLRNPLAAILMSATSLARARELSDKHAAAARRILIASQRMARMVSDLVDLTRTRLGRGVPLSPTATDLGMLCRQVIDELKAAYPARRFVLSCSGDLAGSWDASRLAQVISNLVANAVEHGDPDGPVTVRAASAGATAVLTVHNHGRAIPSTAAGHAGQSASLGLGLGLFIVRELVAAHRGTVGVSSTDEDGTTFTVSLPRDEGSRRKPLRSSARRRDRSPLASVSALG